MKRMLVGLFLVFWCQLVLSDPVVVLMVKNEEKVMAPTLQPFVDGGVTEFVILDTGSEDKTIEVTEQFFAQYPDITVHIIQEPWVDFATSRNFALDATERLFPEATFMLMIDAEWYTHGVERLIKFCEEHKNEILIPYYNITMRGQRIEFVQSRLLRCRRNVRFVGATQECLNVVSCGRVPSDTYFDWNPSQDGMKKSAQRWMRDRDLLLKDYEKNPDNDRTLFYLGITYECLQDWENAYIFYQKRAAMKRWDEEDFLTQCYLGRVARALDLQGEMPIAPMVVQHYLTAYSLRPQRAEPLVELADYYISKGQMNLAYLFALRAAKIPYPENDVLFVEKYIYDYARYDRLGICAWYVGEYEVGCWAVLQAMKADPEAEHLKGNLKLYTEQLAHKKELEFAVN